LALDAGSEQSPPVGVVKTFAVTLNTSLCWKFSERLGLLKVSTILFVPGDDAAKVPDIVLDTLTISTMA
jgi:hypothetical protein